MSRKEVLFIILMFLCSVVLGVILLPKLQKKFAGKLYKAGNRRILREKYGISMNRR